MINYVIWGIIATGLILFALGITLGAHFSGRRLCGLKLFYILPCLLLFYCLLTYGFDAYHATYTLREGGGSEQIDEEIPLALYMPFAEGNLLKSPDFTPSLTISDNYPCLDGATAAYPVYAAISQAVYSGLDQETIKNYVACNTTDEGFEQLISSQCDIFFGVRPSKNQLARAEELGIAITMTKISREAFVFFVNNENTLSDLSIKQIQSIYTKYCKRQTAIISPKAVTPQWQLHLLLL